MVNTGPNFSELDKLRRREGLYIIGGGPHARELAHYCPGPVAGFVVAGPLGPGNHRSHPINMSHKASLFTDEEFRESVYSPWCRIAIGIADCDTKQEVVEKLMSYVNSDQFPQSVFPTIIPKSAHCTEGSQIYHGTTIGPLSFISNGVEIDPFVTVNAKVSISHGCKIGMYSTISPGAVVLGNVSLGQRVFVGANATIRAGIKIASDTTIGMGAVVTKDIDKPGGIYKGSPARRYVRANNVLVRDK